MTTRNWLIAVAAVAFLSAGAATALTYGIAQSRPQAPALAVAPTPPPAAEPVKVVQAAVTRAVPTGNGDVQLSFAPIVSQVAPAVVNVYATTITQQTTSPFAGDPFFERFFGNSSPFFKSRPQTEQSLGSGVIIDSSGLILTNSHVVHGSTDIRVTLSDGHEYPVEIVLDDSKTDLAALRITEDNLPALPFVTFTDSDQLQVGDLVLAIGNPFGVGQTVTSGIVSALARTGVEVSDYSFFIQTDAAINPGNSGGALVDMQGHLVGINSAIFSNSSTGGSLGIGFAIPANMAVLIANAAENGGQVEHPWFGAHFQELDSDLAKNLRLDVPRGALITDLAPGGPAEQAGVEPGDVITSIDGQQVDDPKAFTYRLATKQVGGTAELSVVRNGERMAISLPLVASSADDPSRQTVISANTLFNGITAAELSPALAEEVGVPYDTNGVVVTDVADGSRAARVGFRKGDIMLSLNGETIQTKDDFARLAATATRTWQIVFQRDGQVKRAYLNG